MNKDNPITMKRSVKKYLDDWRNNLKSQGLTGFWPSFMQGQYIRPDNMKAQERMQRKATQKRTDLFMLVSLHGRFIKVKLPKEKYKGQKLTRIQRIVNREIDRRIRWKNYYSESNALNAIAQMLIRGGGRSMRRNLAKKLGLLQHNWKAVYKEAESMVMEQDNFVFEGIKRSFGKVKS